MGCCDVDSGLCGQPAESQKCTTQTQSQTRVPKLRARATEQSPRDKLSNLQSSRPRLRYWFMHFSWSVFNLSILCFLFQIKNQTNVDYNNPKTVKCNNYFHYVWLFLIFASKEPFPNYAGMDYNRTDELRLAANSGNLHNLEIISPACIIPAWHWNMPPAWHWKFPNNSSCSLNWKWKVIAIKRDSYCGPAFQVPSSEFYIGRQEILLIYGRRRNWQKVKSKLGSSSWSLHPRGSRAFWLLFSCKLRPLSDK